MVQAWSPPPDETQLKEEGVVEWNEGRLKTAVTAE